MNPPVTLLLRDLCAPNSHVTDHDFSFPWDVCRFGLNASPVILTVEVLIAENKSRPYAQLCEEVKLADGWAIQADSILMLTTAEQDAINASDELRDWIREGLEADEEARQDAAECHRDFLREGGGLIRCF